MKKGWIWIIGGTVCLALCGTVLSLSAGHSLQTLDKLTRFCFLGAVAGFFVIALFRPRAYQMNDVGGKGVEMAAAADLRCSFKDVAANEEARNSLEGLVNYLKDPEKYARYGARMPRGVMLYGPPGTGKTLLAKALAGEAGVPFFALSGSDFVQMYVGVGAGRVRALFEKARKAGKCVIFIDEIDAVGKRRDQSASEERDQTLNALLSEMSGFRDAEGIIVLAATNRLEALDPALLRPGRFDRQIEVGLPGKKEWLSILRLHSRNKPVAGDVDLEQLAADTSCFSGASLENLLNEAAIAAAARDAEQISTEDIRCAFFREVAGAERENLASGREREIIALHEAGHAIASRVLMPENHLARVSILPAGRGAAGYNLTIPAERVMVEKRDIENGICVLLAGRAAEAIVKGDEAITAGASNDLARATELAGSMVLDLGMAGEQAVALRVLAQNCGGSVSAADMCRDLLEKLYVQTKNLIFSHMKELTCLQEALLKNEVMSGEEIDALLKAVQDKDVG